MPISILQFLQQVPTADRYWVAYSGGMDSHVLLHLLSTAKSQLPGTLSAIHVNHHISKASGDWEAHCATECERLDIPFLALGVDGQAANGESPEAAAREARYAAFKKQLGAGDVLFTAQHQDDQAETLLLQLFRGAGPKGLASMPNSMPLGKGILLRPFLNISQKQIANYASEHALQWIEDPSNVDTRFDRNYLRKKIIPALKDRWPGLSAVLSRSACNQADQLEVADALAVIDLESCVYTQSEDLKINAFLLLTPARQRNLLRYWIDQRSFLIPPRVVIERIRSEIFHSRADATPLVQWPEAEVRRYRNRAYLMRPLSEHDLTETMNWTPGQLLELPKLCRKWRAVQVRGEGFYLSENKAVQIRFRQGGETLRPSGRAHPHRLKHLFQEWGIPEWERSRVPLLYLDDELIAVAGQCVCEGFQATSDQRGWVLKSQ